MRRRRTSLVVTLAVALLAPGCGGDDRQSNDAASRDTASDQAEETQAEETTTAPVPEIEGPVTEPGDPYIDPLETGFPAEDTAEASGYVFEEYEVSGTAGGDPYRVRLQIAQPGEGAEPFSGHVFVEAIHPQGIPFVWNFTRPYLMAEGHAAVNISVFPNTVETLQEANPGRYDDLQVRSDETNEAGGIDFDQASDIYAQVGRLLKSEDTPLDGVESMYMTGHSRSVGPVWQYMDTHHNVQRLPGGEPIYDGFFPETTRTASRMGPFPHVDVPTLLINSELEVEEVLVKEGIDYRRPDSDEPGEQFRLYEVAGMPHNLSWMHPLLLDGLDIQSSASELCLNPLNGFPYNPMVTMAFDQLIRWVGEGVEPPRADRIELTEDVGEEGTAIRRDEHGNAVGGVRTTTMDVPVATHQALNEPVNPDEDLTPGSCLVYGSQLDFSAEELVSLYGDKANYVDVVDERLEELVTEGWYLGQFADEVRQQAEAFDGF